jgi:hypothetical protein
MLYEMLVYSDGYPMLRQALLKSLKWHLAVIAAVCEAGLILSIVVLGTSDIDSASFLTC